MAVLRKVSTNVIDTPSKNDRNQWLAGDGLRDETFPGGSLWSPVSRPNIELISPAVNKTAQLLNGNILGFLGYKFGGIQGLLQAQHINMLFEESIIKTNIVHVVVDVTSMDGVTTIKDGEFVIDTLGQPLSNVGNVTPADIAAVMDNSKGTLQENLSGLLGQMLMGSPIGSTIGISIYNGLTGQTERFEQVVGQYAITQTLGMMTRGVQQMANSVLGVTSPLMSLSIGFLASALVAEAFEVMTGLDNHFGFGGDVVGFNAQGLGAYESAISLRAGLLDTLKEIATLGYAETRTYNGIDDGTSNQLAMASGLQLGQASAAYAETTTSTLGSFNELVANLEANDFLGGGDSYAAPGSLMGDIFGIGFGDTEDDSGEGFQNEYGGYDNFDDAYNDYFGGDGFGGDDGYDGNDY